jgi:hypothetical protein
MIGCPDATNMNSGIPENAGSAFVSTETRFSAFARLATVISRTHASTKLVIRRMILRRAAHFTVHFAPDQLLGQVAIQSLTGQYWRVS